MKKTPFPSNLWMIKIHPLKNRIEPSLGPRGPWFCTGLSGCSKSTMSTVIVFFRQKGRGDRDEHREKIRHYMFPCSSMVRVMLCINWLYIFWTSGWNLWMFSDLWDFSSTTKTRIQSKSVSSKGFRCVSVCALCIVGKIFSTCRVLSKNHKL